jgi:hypothetical protein
MSSENSQHIADWYWMIRDNLALNILMLLWPMLLWPLESVKAWQAGG